MISDVTATSDDAGFPVVSWIEARRLGDPEKIECRIMKTADGELYFVARGAVRLGTFEDGRPWELLQGFAIKSAEGLYQEHAEGELHRYLDKKNPIFGALLRDGSKVLVAGFRVGMPLHLNCADAPLGQLERLHAVLSEAFIHRAKLGLDSGWRCSPDDGRVATYDPARTGWPGKEPSKRFVDRSFPWLVNLGLAALLLGMVLFLVYLVRLLVGMVAI